MSLPVRIWMLLAAAGAAQAQGIMPGAKAPDFHLPDQTGAMRALTDLRGPNGTMLVFYRSADW